MKRHDSHDDLDQSLKSLAVSWDKEREQMVHQKVMEQIDLAENKPSRGFKIAFSTVKAMLLVTLCIGALMLIFQSTMQDSPSKGIITDHVTTPEIKTVTVEEGMITIEHRLDNMDRGNHDYSTNHHSLLVVDLNYNHSDSKRGDVIYFKMPDFTYEENPNLTPSDYNVSRIVGLPGETIKIEEGQIYINDKKISAFYGRAHWRGNDLESYKTLLENGNEKDHVKSMLQSMKKEKMDAIDIPDGHVFVIGDTWGRSIDSRIFGPLSVEKIEGEVIGYESDDGQENPLGKLDLDGSETPPTGASILSEADESFMDNFDLPSYIPEEVKDYVEVQKSTRDDGTEDIDIIYGEGRQHVMIMNQALDSEESKEILLERMMKQYNPIEEVEIRKYTGYLAPNQNIGPGLESITWTPIS